MLWKRKKKPETGLTREDMHQDVRDHHYVFAHIALREACESDPQQFFSMLESPEPGRLLGHLWQQVCDNIEGSPEDIEMTTIQIAPCQVLGARAVLIVMPEARRIAEAIMVLVVETHAIEGMESASLPFRYFTLELGEDDQGLPCGVFAEWAGHSHLNYGGGPLPDARGFIRWVESCLDPA